jgi:hypothetical protein
MPRAFARVSSEEPGSESGIMSGAGKHPQGVPRSPDDKINRDEAGEI